MDVFEAFCEFMLEDEGIQVPVSRAVCPRCDGTGAHTNSSIGAITASEWAEWDDEERDAYRAGAYDVACEECGGRNVVEVLADCASDEIREAWAKWQADERSSRAEAAAECRMGA